MEQREQGGPQVPAVAEGIAKLVGMPVESAGTVGCKKKVLFGRDKSALEEYADLEPAQRQRRDISGNVGES